MKYIIERTGVVIANTSDMGFSYKLHDELELIICYSAMMDAVILEGAYTATGEDIIAYLSESCRGILRLAAWRHFMDIKAHAYHYPLSTNPLRISGEVTC